MGNYTVQHLNSLAAEYEVSEVLEHFNSQYVFDIIQDKIRNRFTPNIVITATNPNVVLGFEDNFRRCLATYPEDTANITAVRQETYHEIIDIISRSYGFTVNLTEDIDFYTYAYYLYDFFVCNFTTFISKFFADYIYTNKDMLYQALGLEAFKKQKDGATAYGRRIYNDNKLAVISANIVMVANALKSFDITPEIIFYDIYGNRDIVNMLSSTIALPYDMFKELFFNVPEDFQPILFTDMRLELQAIAKRNGDITN